MPNNRCSFAKKSWLFFLLLTAACGILLHYPYLDFNNLLSQGDHGRDLYCFKKTLDGSLPYKDYWWVYGPLMPYYYGLFFKWLGIHIKSALAGQAVLDVASGIFFYLAMSVFAEPFLACLAALWFWTFNPGFFFTYNHAGGIAASLALVYFLFLYIRDGRLSFAYWGFIWAFILALIKLNMGVFLLAGFLLCIVITDITRKNLTFFKKKIYFLAALAVLLLSGLVYLFFLYGLPAYVIHQCVIILRADHPYYSPLAQSLYALWLSIFTKIWGSWPNMMICALMVFLAVQIFLSVWRKKMEPKYQRDILLALGSLVVFIGLSLHEFLDSGVFYRSFWMAPFKFLLMFLVISAGTRRLAKPIPILLCCALITVLGMENWGKYRLVGELRQPSQYLALRRAQVYVTNSPQWVDTVTQTVQFLTKTLTKDETFFALPYDPLYYFLAEKDSPTRQLIFFDHINIPPEQERGIIRELEKRNVHYVLLSSRITTTEPQLGTFGKTYCPILAKYIEGNFRTIAVFGDWQNDAGWAWNHGTKILKRVSGTP